MPIHSTHPDYETMLPAWQRARDVLAGEDAVKAAGEKYLPRLDSQNDEEYAAFRGRASFFGATARTLEEYLELIFRKAPTVATVNSQATTLNKFLSDCDRWGTDFVGYARRVVSEVLVVGRAGSLVLPAFSPAPSVSLTLNSQPSTLNFRNRPAVSLWKAEDILNWKVERREEMPTLTELVLRDGDRLRVFRLEDPNGGEPACVQEVWRRNGEEWVLLDQASVVREGVALPFIPFVFHGPRHSRPDPDRLPLGDIIATNLDQYRLDADFKHGAHFAALPTAWVSGFDKSAPLRIGSSTAWVSEVAGASAGFLEFTGAGLSYLERAMEKVERRMAQLGARMLETSSTFVSSSSAISHQPSTLYGLGSIVASLNQSLSRVLLLAQWWMQGGELDQLAGRVSFAMNTDLGARAMSGEEISAVVSAWRSGAISRDTMLERLKRGEVLPDGRSVAEERARIHGKRGEG